MKNYKYFAVIFCCAGFTGCGIQMPVTEGLVFSSSNPYGKSHEEILPFIRYGGGVTTFSTFAAYSRLTEKAIKKYGSNESKDLNRDYMTAAGYPGLGFSYGEGKRLAVAITPGYIIAGTHVDATVRTVEKIFITFNHNILHNGTELILQRPLFEKNGGGLSLGVFYRNQTMQFVKENEQWSYSEPGFRIKWYGMRLMGQSPVPYSFTKIRGFVNAGYVSGFDVPLITTGIAIVLD